MKNQSVGPANPDMRWFEMNISVKHFQEYSIHEYILQFYLFLFGPMMFKYVEIKVR